MTFPPGGRQVTTPNRSVFLTQHLSHRFPMTTPHLLCRSHVLTRTSPFVSIKLDWLWPPLHSEDPSLRVVPLKCRTSPWYSSQNCPTSRTVHPNKLYQTGAKARRTVNQTVRSRDRRGSLPLPCRQTGLLMSWGWTIILPLMTSKMPGKALTQDVWYKCLLSEMSVLTAIRNTGRSRCNNFTTDTIPII